jgi:hypothetical protein
MQDFLDRHQHRVNLIVGSAVTAFGWVLGGSIAAYLLVSLIVGMVDVATWLGRIG